MLSIPSIKDSDMPKTLMEFAELFAQSNAYTSIRLDVYSQNRLATEFYKNRGYQMRGHIYFHEREHPFYCMEKEIKKTSNNVTVN